MNSYYYDLHIHSCLSPCADDDMTPNNIAGMAALKGLQMIALTDHNSCKNCPAFFEACKRQGIIAIAGMELSTAEDIHLVCLFEELEQAMEFDAVVSEHLLNIKNRPEIFGNQLILNGEDEQIGCEEKLLISSTDLLIADAVELAKKYGAHIHPAHIDRESNGIIAILGDIPSEYGFDCLEFNDSKNIDAISERYPHLSAAKRLVSSDAHYLWDISEADNFVQLDDVPYSSSMVRKRFFEYLKGTNT
ncbi:MAG: PHP domain-containing protein [Ruminococcaceae bacterium]|nr:PHP domain-containing protein [Oscillospiraceae bacterium]